jgi:hypothetical protein
MNTEEIHVTLRPRWWWPLLAGVLFGLVLRMLYSGKPGDMFETMSGSFALLAPIAVSAVTVYVAELRARRTWAYYFWMGALANVLFVTGTFLIHIEGLICVILAAPLFSIIGGVAGLIVGAVFRWTRWMRRATYCFALLPVVLGTYEHYLPLPQNIHTVERTITVAAPRADVWDQLMTAPAIQPAEIDNGLMYRIGVPLPESALAGETDEGSLVRRIRMGKGIQFDQIATEWEVCRRVRWRYHFTPDSFPPRALDDHVCRLKCRYPGQPTRQTHVCQPNLADPYVKDDGNIDGHDRPDRKRPRQRDQRRHHVAPQYRSATRIMLLSTPAEPS